MARGFLVQSLPKQPRDARAAEYDNAADAIRVARRTFASLPRHRYHGIRVEAPDGTTIYQRFKRRG